MKFIRLVIVFAAMGIMGIVLMVSAIRDKTELAKPRGNLETMTAEDFYNGRFVEGTIDELWHNFGYIKDSDSGKTTANYYALPIPSSYYNDDEDLKFVALAVTNSSRKLTADKMEKETIAYLNNGTEPAAWTTMHIVGKVTKLKGKMLDYFKEYIIDDMGGEAENYIPYVINVDNTGSGTNGILALSIGLTIIGLGGSALMIVRRIIRGK